MSQATRQIARRSRNSRQSRGDIVFETIVVILLALLALVIIYPLYFVVIASFSEAKAVVGGEVIFLPKGLTLDNYMECFKNGDLMLGYKNAFILLIIGTAVGVHWGSRVDEKKFRAVVITLIFVSGLSLLF